MEYAQDDHLWGALLSQNGYELLGHLESGSFSEVFVVKARGSGRLAAAKRLVVRRDVSADPALVAELSCLRLLNTVRGSCVVRLEESIVAERLACLILELAPLGDLEHYTAATGRWPLDPPLLKAITRQVLSALTHCHRLHIAHRDLNPANVLLVSPRLVRLADFGLAVLSRPDPHTGPALCTSYLGRQSYLAPEVLRQRPYDPFQADMWSLGCLGLFLLTGKHIGLANAFRQGTETTSKLYHPETCVEDRQQCAYVSFSPTSRSYRTNSNGSEYSCRSESDAEDVSPHQPLYDTCVKGRLFSQDSTEAADECHESPFLWTTSESEGIVFQRQHATTHPAADITNTVSFKRAFDTMACICTLVNSELKNMSPLEVALLNFTAKLCVIEPPERPSAETGLELWKRLVSSEQTC